MKSASLFLAHCSFRMLNRHFIFLLTILAGVILVLAPFAAYASYELAYRGRVYPGIKLDNTKEQLSVGTVTVQFHQNETSQLIKQWDVPIDSFDVQTDWPATQKKLINTGRRGNFIDDLKIKILAWRQGVAIEPVLSYDRQKVEDFVAAVSAEIDKPVVEPKFKLVNGRVVEFQQGRDGLTTQKQLFTDRIIMAAFYTASSSPIEIPAAVQQPTAPAGDMTAESLGIKEKIGVGTSTYKGSIPGRKHNVALTASRLNGSLVAPGATFSFNDAIGDVSSETGFQQAYVIKDGRTELGDGGGVCQVSTTLFRAVLAAGLPIGERRTHSYRVGYYEQNSPPGFDATVYSPTTDFKFINDTQSYLLIQAKADNSTASLIVEIWGTSDGRVAKTTKPVVTDQVAPPPDVYQDDPSIPAGQVRQVDWKAWGAKVTFSYTVTRGGETIYQKTFVSNYKPWQAVFLKGTGN